MKISPELKKFCFASNISEALEIQKSLISLFEPKGIISLQNVNLVAACDVSYRQGLSVASCVIYSRKEKKFVEEVVSTSKTVFPYVPTFLSFREIPALLEVIEKLEKTPDVFLFDGQGIAHPRKMGLATHIGCILKIPTVGCAKSHLWGSYEEPPPAKGSSTFLKDPSGEVIGVVLRTRANVKPLFVSIGWGVDVSFCEELVFSLVDKYRIPLPLSFAHKVGRRLLT